MIEGRSGGSWRGTRRELWAPLQRFFNQRIVRCIVYRRSTLAAHSFPSLRRFLIVCTCIEWRGPKGRLMKGRFARTERTLVQSRSILFVKKYHIIIDL